METKFKELYFEFHPRLIRIAFYILKDKTAAEDICQEVFMQFWNKRANWGDIDSIEGYLVQMTKNASLSHLESKKRESDQLISLRDLDPVSAQDEDKANRERLFRVALEGAISQLSPQCRLIFSLSRFEGLSNEEIALYLEISKRTVETQISIAFKRFRSDLRHFFLTNMILLLAFLSFF